MAIISIGKNSIANLETVFDETNEFTKDMKKLNKKYNSIYEDLEIFKAALITALPAGLPGIFAISDLGDHIELPVYKVKKFRCKSSWGDVGRNIVVCDAGPTGRIDGGYMMVIDVFLGGLYATVFVLFIFYLLSKSNLSWMG